MRGIKTTETELDVPVADVWDLYGTLKLAKLMEERLPMLVDKITIDGNGGVGTVLHIRLTRGLPFSHYKEKIVLLDNENHVKIMEVVEGGFLDLGYSLFRIRFEVIEKDKDASIIRSTTEYAIDEQFAAIAPPITNDALELVAQASAAYLLQKKFEASIRNALSGEYSEDDDLIISLAAADDDQEMIGTSRSVPPNAKETEAGARSISPTTRPTTTAEEIDHSVRSVRPQHTSATTE